MLNISLYEELIREQSRPMTRVERERIDLLREIEKASAESRRGAVRRWLKGRLGGTYEASPRSGNEVDREAGADSILTVS